MPIPSGAAGKGSMASSVVAIPEEESLGESIDVDDAIPTLAYRRLPGLVCRILYVRIRW
jgi:hypothetical protein